MVKPKVRALVTALFTALYLLAPGVGAADSPVASDLRFTILHTNDLHAHDEPFADRGRNIGGMARIAHIIRAIKAKDPNVVTIDAGDIFQGTPFFKFYHGQVEVEMLNRAGYDIYTIGNHEFDDGSANLAQQLKNAHFDIISANMDATAVPQLNAEIKSSVVRTIAGEKVGFIGGIVPNLTEVALRTEGVKLKKTGDQWMDPIKDEIAKLKAQGINKIILVTHCGVEADKQLAAALPDVDAIIGGHSHTRLDKAIVVDHPDGSQCIIVQTGSYGRALGKLDLDFNSAGRLQLSKTHYHLINITNRIHEEPDIKAYLIEKSQPFQKMRTTVVSNAAGAFDNAFRRYAWDSSLGDLVADSLAEAGASSGVTIALQNRGGIRGRIDPGPITEEKVDELLPFENHLIFATITGSTLLKVLEQSVSGEGLGGKFLDVHGLKYAYDRDKPSYQRVQWVLAQATDGAWKPLDLAGKYRIAINDYSFKGGEGFDFTSATDVKDTGERLSKYFLQYLSHHKVLTPQLPNRIVPVSDSLCSLSCKADKPEITVRAKENPAKLFVIQGSGHDVVTLPGMKVPVPLKQPRLIRTISVAAGQESLHFTVPRSNGAAQEYVTLLMPKTHKDVAQIGIARCSP